MGAEEAAQEESQEKQAKQQLHLGAWRKRTFVGMDAAGQRREDAKGQCRKNDGGGHNRSSERSGCVWGIHAEKHRPAFGNQQNQVAPGDGRVEDEASGHLKRLPAVAGVPDPERRGPDGKANDAAKPETKP